MISVTFLATIFLLYWTVFWIFFLFPRFKIKKANKFMRAFLEAKPFMVVGHRGGLMEHPENTISGVEAAIQKKYNVELDLQKSKDGKYFLCHDNDLIRVTGQNVYSRDINYSELNPVMDNIHNSYNDSISPAKNPRKLKPLLLEDLIKAVRPHPNLYLSVDVKTEHEEDLIEVIEIFKKFGMEERIIIGSFRYYDVEKIKKKYKCENVAFFAGVKQCGFIIYAMVLGILPYINLDCDVYCYPYYFESLPKM